MSPLLTTEWTSVLPICTALGAEPDVDTFGVEVVAAFRLAVRDDFSLGVKVHVANRAVVLDRLPVTIVVEVFFRSHGSCVGCVEDLVKLPSSQGVLVE